VSSLLGIWPGHGRFANITWQVSDVCNFRCSYCNPGNWGGHHKNLDIDTYVSVLGRIIDFFQSKGYTGFKMFFSGGEPSVWPPLIPICQFIRSRVERPSMAINTNLSRPLDWWQEHRYLFNDVVASFHIEFTNKDKYLENVLFLQDHLSYLACRLLMHDERFAEVVEFGELLKQRLDNAVIEYAPLFEELTPHAGMHHYADAWKRDFLTGNVYWAKRRQIDLPNRPAPAYCDEHWSDGMRRGLNSNRIVGEGLNHFEGWTCWINDAITINPRGDIRLASCNASQLVGNINEGTVRFLDEPVVCGEKNCNCGTDINIPKLSPGYTPAEPA
jgi:organic radical activating enzyme